jgi:hypothetical protein
LGKRNLGLKGGIAAEEGNAQGLSDGEKERKGLGVFYLPIERGVNAGQFSERILINAGSGWLL